MRPVFRLCSAPRQTFSKTAVGLLLAWWTLVPSTWAQTTEGPEPVRTSITVVEKISTEAPANITVVGRSELRETPGVNLDDRLREIPGFSMFRRSSSLVAHPTTQGLSLRGIGSSGASRTLVLWDGIPLNDPFGGWVYWTRVAPEELERVEVSRGASTAVFGDRALGGAVGLFSREAERGRLIAGYEAGNRGTHEVSTGYSHAWQRIGLSGYGRAFTTDGYYIVPEEIRGDIDRKAGVRFVAGDVRLDYLGTQNRAFLRTDLLVEDRRNGTAMQNNSTSLGTIAGQYQHERPNDIISLLGFHTREEFRSSFSSIAADRNTERPTFWQTVPSEAVGGAALWRHSASRWNVLAGGDAFRVEGTSIDALFPTGQRIGGGTQLQHGAFVQADATAGMARFFAGARHHFTGQDRQFFSPAGGMVVGRGSWRARGSVYRSFRAPTLNELFREFRVGNAVTQANSALRPERLFGAEAGIDYIGEMVTMRVTAYRNSIDDIVTNVTLSTAPNLVVRQRQNAVSALGRGVEFDSAARWRFLRGEFRYLYADTEFANGRDVPQIPRYQMTWQIMADWHGTLASFGQRSFSGQFEDDLNSFFLPQYRTLQLVVRQHLTRGLSALVQIENIRDAQYLSALSPTPTLGTPRLWRAGLRWNGRIW